MTIVVNVATPPVEKQFYRTTAIITDQVDIDTICFELNDLIVAGVETTSITYKYARAYYAANGLKKLILKPKIVDYQSSVLVGNQDFLFVFIDTDDVTEKNDFSLYIEDTKFLFVTQGLFSEEATNYTGRSRTILVGTEPITLIATEYATGYNLFGDEAGNALIMEDLVDILSMDAGGALITENDELITTTTLSEHAQYISAYIVATLGNAKPAEKTWHFVDMGNLYPTEPIHENALYITEDYGVNVLYGGKTMSGEWIDVLILKTWLENALQTQMFNLFYTTNKIPNTPSGLLQISNSVGQVLEIAHNLGGIEKDYKVDVVSGGGRNSKVTFTARLTGAIHDADIVGTVIF